MAVQRAHSTDAGQGVASALTGHQQSNKVVALLTTDAEHDFPSSTVAVTQLRFTALKNPRYRTFTATIATEPRRGQGIDYRTMAVPSRWHARGTINVRSGEIIYQLSPVMRLAGG